MFFLFFLKFFVSSLKTVFALISKPFFYFIILFSLCTNSFAINYIPIEALTTQQKKYLPNHISIIDKKNSLKLDFDHFAADIFYDAYNKNYTALMPDDSRLTVLVKDTAMIITWLDKDNKNYKTALYRREDLRLPQKGRYFRVAPNRDDYFISSPNFIDSYAFWTGDEVMHAYDLLSYKEQGVLKLFPYVSIEILNKLCHAKDKKAGFIKLLTHHKTSCDILPKRYSALQISDEYTDFQKKLTDEKTLLSHIFACNHGLMPPQKCRTFQKALSKKALSPLTLHFILN